MPKKKRSSEESSLPSLALVFGYIAVKDLQRLEDRVKILSRLGYGNAEMSAICGITPAHVATLKHRASKGER
ncbi:MAG: hypothetical protein WBC51_08330 [Vicinamibacterales bacterium]